MNTDILSYAREHGDITVTMKLSDLADLIERAVRPPAMTQGVISFEEPEQEEKKAAGGGVMVSGHIKGAPWNDGMIQKETQVQRLMKRHGVSRKFIRELVFDGHDWPFQYVQRGDNRYICFTEDTCSRMDGLVVRIQQNMNKPCTNQ